MRACQPERHAQVDGQVCSGSHLQSYVCVSLTRVSDAIETSSYLNLKMVQQVVAFPSAGLSLLARSSAQPSCPCRSP